VHTHWLDSCHSFFCAKSPWTKSVIISIHFHSQFALNVGQTFDIQLLYMYNDFE
jgi:hypothetical protein